MSGAGDIPAELRGLVNLEIEMALLGAVLSNNRTYDQVAGFLEPRHFADPLHGRIYDACGRLIEAGQIADAITLRNYFEQDGSLKEIGGPVYLARLAASVVTFINAADYGRLIVDLCLRRELLRLRDEIGERVRLQAGDGPLETAEDVIDGITAELDRIAGGPSSADGPRRLELVAHDAVLQAEAAHQQDRSVIGLSTGLAAIDNLLGGLRPGQMVVVGGRPSMGKTALALTMGLAAARAGARVLMHSLEMSAEELAMRVISQESRIPVNAINRGQVHASKFSDLLAAEHTTKGLPFFIEDEPDPALVSMTAQARRLKAELVIVDYLQLVQRVAPGDRFQSDVQRVTAVSRGLKVMAKKLGVPVLALSQLSRQLEQRDDKRPTLADLRESGAIEQDSDVVMFVYREEYYLRDQPQRKLNESDAAWSERWRRYELAVEDCAGRADILIAKHKQGPIGTARLSFDHTFMEFSDPEAAAADARQEGFEL